ncbi:MAG: EAL domain-containing protein [Beijerinckiaceae bacterium]|nr:EAL domain-containing protein [Beijerinckiaceae bacterium]
MPDRFRSIMPLPPTLRGRIALLASLNTIAIVILLTLVSVVAAISFARERLIGDAQFTTRLVEERLSLVVEGLMRDTIRLSKSPIVSTALLDTRDRGAVLLPFLRSLQSETTNALGGQSYLFDYRARPVLSTEPNMRASSPAIAELAAQALREAKPLVGILPPLPGQVDSQRRLAIVSPVSYPYLDGSMGVLAQTYDFGAITAPVIRFGGRDFSLEIEPAGAASEISETSVRRIAVQRTIRVQFDEASLELDISLYFIGDPIATIARQFTLLGLTSALLLSALSAFLARRFASRITWQLGLLTEASTHFASGQPFALRPRGWSSELQVLADTLNSAFMQQRRLMHNLEQTAAVFRSSGEGIVVLDKRGRIRESNLAFERLVGKKPQSLVGRPIWSLPFVNGEAEISQALTSAEPGEVTKRELILKNEQEELTLQMTLSQVAAGEDDLIAEYVCLLSDITAQKNAQKALAYVAHHDGLTGLYNRSFFERTTSRSINRASRTGEKLALLFLDLDRFKIVNDVFGHAAGDEIIRVVADRLRNRLRASDIVSRRGGDEFMILLDPVAETSTAMGLANDLINLVNEPVTIESGETLTVGVTIGISIYPDDAATIDDMMRHADLALNFAKTAGKGRAELFSAHIRDINNRRYRVETRLRHALDHELLTFHYQPQIDIASGRVSGFEALLRWTDAELGPVPAGEATSVAEDSGLMPRFTELMLYKTMRDTVSIIKENGTDLRLAVNFSANDCADVTIVERVERIANEIGFPLECLEIEVTETVLSDQRSQAITTLEQFRARGIEIAIDDFGVGYSSLSRLQRLPVTRLKIDGSFVAGLPHDRDSDGIINAIVTIADSLGMRTIAEGVETAPQLMALKRLHCHTVQGYYFAPSLNINALRAYVFEVNAAKCVLV